MEERRITKAEFEAAADKVVKDQINDPNIEGAAKLFIPLTGHIFADKMKEILFPEEVTG